MSGKQLKKNQADTKLSEPTNLINTNNTTDESTAIDNKETVSSANEPENTEQMKDMLARVIEQEFVGPIPPPSVISGYENVIPGSADRIIRMAEQQSLHRQQMELLEIKAESRDSFLGVIFAFGLGAGCLIACSVMVIMVPATAGAVCGSILGVTGIGSIVTAFLKNTRKTDK